MGLLAIALNDVGLRAARPPGDQLLAVDGPHRSSPGFAWVRTKTLLTGFAAAEQARLHPLEVNHRFWDQLDTEPADPKDPRSPNRAEVACAHLQKVVEGAGHAGEDVVVAVPPSYETRQLGIVVGIARELKLPLQALVASPVALDFGPAPSGTVMVVELTLHRAVVSVVEADDHLALSQTQVCPEMGLHALRRQWIKGLADEFVRTTRFDALHDPATEQQLHDRLSEILEGVPHGASYPLALQSGSHAYRVTLTDELFAQWGHDLLCRLCDRAQAAMASGRPTEILLTDEAAQVPGLRPMLQQQTQIPVRSLEAGATVRGLVRFWPERFEQTASPGVAYHTRRGGVTLINSTS